METNNKQQIIEDFIKTLPEVNAIYGYGSGVINQVGIGSKCGQIDLIVVVGDTDIFHAKNLRLNPEFYSKHMKKFFTKNLKLQHMGADICYIPYIKYKENIFKIGIISRDDLIEDLKNWKNLYMAGRFQKPIVTFKPDKRIEAAIIENRKNALLISLILQKCSHACNLYQLYHTIVSLSYIGDIRTGVSVGKLKLFNFENPHKIDNIIAGSYKTLNSIYFDSRINNHYFRISDEKNIDFTVNENLDQIERNKEIIDHLKNIKLYYDQKCLAEQIAYLPKYFSDFLSHDLVGFNNLMDNDIITANQLRIIKNEFIRFFMKTNQKTTKLQSIKGFLAIGVNDSFKYLYEKSLKSKTK